MLAYILQVKNTHQPIVSKVYIWSRMNSLGIYTNRMKTILFAPKNKLMKATFQSSSNAGCFKTTLCLHAITTHNLKIHTT